MNRIHLVFKDGQFVANQSDLRALPKTIQWNTDEGFFLQVPDHTEITLPIHLLFLRSESGSVSFRQQIKLGEGARVTLIEEHTDENDFPLNASTEITAHWDLGPQSTLQYFKLQDENLATSHYAKIVVDQAALSLSHIFLADCGSRLVDNHVNIYLKGHHAACQLNGLYFLNHDKQQLNHQLQIEHLAPFSTSAMQFKGILDHQSQALFQGKVYVHAAAEHITAHQANHNLLLSPHASVQTQPQLEIYADEVKCTHGATVGHLDNESLFYLRSRGIEEAAALKLLTQAFAADIINQMTDPLIKDYIQARIHAHETVSS